VTLHGRILARYYRPNTSVILQPGVERDIPGFGHCYSDSHQEAGTYALNGTAVVCESPETTAENFEIQWNSQGELISRGVHLSERFSFGFQPYPDMKWLSPMRKGTLLFKGVEPETFVVTPETPLGSAVID